MYYESLLTLSAHVLYHKLLQGRKFGIKKGTHSKPYYTYGYVTSGIMNRQNEFLYQHGQKHMDYCGNILITSIHADNKQAVKWLLANMKHDYIHIVLRHHVSYTKPGATVRWLVHNGIVDTSIKDFHWIFRSACFDERICLIKWLITRYQKYHGRDAVLEYIKMDNCYASRVADEMGYIRLRELLDQI